MDKDTMVVFQKPHQTHIDIDGFFVGLPLANIYFRVWLAWDGEEWGYVRREVCSFREYEEWARENTEATK